METNAYMSTSTFSIALPVSTSIVNLSFEFFFHDFHVYINPVLKILYPVQQQAILFVKIYLGPRLGHSSR